MIRPSSPATGSRSATGNVGGPAQRPVPPRLLVASAFSIPSAPLVRFSKFSQQVVPAHCFGRPEAQDNAFALFYRKQLFILLILCFQKRLGLFKLCPVLNDVYCSCHHYSHVTHPVL